MAADDVGSRGEVGERDRAEDALGLADDVVVHEQDVRRSAGLDRLVHARGRSRRSRRGCACSMTRSWSPSASSAVGEARLVAHLLGALVDDDDLVEKLRAPSGSSPIWVSSLATEVGGRFIVVMPMVTAPGSARSSAGGRASSASSSDERRRRRRRRRTSTSRRRSNGSSGSVEASTVVRAVGRRARRRAAASGRWPSSGRR